MYWVFKMNFILGIVNAIAFAVGCVACYRIGLDTAQTIEIRRNIEILCSLDLENLSDDYLDGVYFALDMKRGDKE